MAALRNVSKHLTQGQMKHASCSFTLDSSAYCVGYDDALYETMKNDVNRTTFYQRCIETYCPNKTVLDIGCGSLALLSILAAKANAHKVFGIEINKASFQNAQRLIKEQGLAHKIDLVHGHSDAIQLPQQCDILVHEIIGEIGSCEGVYNAIKNAKQKFLKPHKQCKPNHNDDDKDTHEHVWSIPDHVQTYVTPVQFPDVDYWQSLQPKVICNEYCQTMNLWNYPHRHFLCGVHEWALWEHIQFNNDLKCNQHKHDQFELKEHEFVAAQDGVLGGILAAVEIGVDPQRQYLLSNKPTQNNCHWANKLMILNEKIQVHKGDTIYVSAKTNPDDAVLKYEFHVTVKHYQ